MASSAGSNLIESIASGLRQASTQALDLSFNELLDMHENGELKISLDYQRLFRWTEGQRSRLIESLLLEMPVPPIFVIEEEEGTVLAHRWATANFVLPTPPRKTRCTPSRSSCSEGGYAHSDGL